MVSIVLPTYNEADKAGPGGKILGRGGPWTENGFYVIYALNRTGRRRVFDNPVGPR
jgi:hypothetical protein